MELQGRLLELHELCNGAVVDSDGIEFQGAAF